NRYHPHRVPCRAYRRVALGHHPSAPVPHGCRRDSPGGYAPRYLYSETAWPAPPFLKAEDPERFFSRILRSALYSLPIKPSRRRKQRNAYFSLSTGFSVAVTRLAFLLISQSAEMKWV